MESAHFLTSQKDQVSVLCKRGKAELMGSVRFKARLTLHQYSSDKTQHRYEEKTVLHQWSMDALHEFGEIIGTIWPEGIVMKKEQLAEQ